MRLTHFWGWHAWGWIRYQDHLSFFALLLKPADTDIIKRFIRSLLDKDP